MTHFDCNALHFPLIWRLLIDDHYMLYVYGRSLIPIVGLYNMFLPKSSELAACSYVSTSICSQWLTWWPSMRMWMHVAPLYLSVWLVLLPALWLVSSSWCVPSCSVSVDLALSTPLSLVLFLKKDIVSFPGFSFLPLVWLKLKNEIKTCKECKAVNSV